MRGSTNTPSRPGFAFLVKRFCLSLALALAAAGPAAAAVPADLPTQAKVAGEPVVLVVQPAAVHLTGPRAVQQVVVSGRYADGSVRDLTPFCAYAAEADDVAAVDAEGFVTPRKNGSTALLVRAGVQTVRVQLT